MKPPSTSAYNTVASEESNDTKSQVIPHTSPISTKEPSDGIVGGETWTRGELQPLAYRDKKFAIAFWVHFLFVIVTSSFAPSIIRDIVQDVQESRSIEILKKNRLLHVLDVDREMEPKLYDGAPGGYSTTQDSNANSLTINHVRSFNTEFGNNTENVNHNSHDYNNRDFDTRNGSDPFGGLDLSRAMSFSVFVIAASIFISLGFLLVALFYLQHHAEEIIKGSFFFIIGYFASKGIHSLLSSGLPDINNFNGSSQGREMIRKANEDGKFAIASIDFILCIFFACYAKAFWKNIPFAASTMRTGVTACKSNLGVFTFAFFTPLLNVLILTVQTMALVTILNFLGAFEEQDAATSKTSVYMAVTLFILSVFWTWEVTKNVSVAIVSGAVGTWWFTPREASSFCSSAVTGSIRRATTYSFGSICFGSLIVTVLNVANDSLIRLRQSKQCLLLFCVVQCLLELLEKLAEYFNKWAMIYVGLYGYDFLTAGKSAVTLFKARGWSSIISNNLVHRALMTVATFISLATGLLVSIIWNLSQFNNSDNQVVQLFSFIYFYIGFVVSLINSNILLSVIGAASDTAIVCFAEASCELEVNHPELSVMMHVSYAQAWPEVDFRREQV
mmetsp:Transcript_6068/g.11495  ORF Transcript_6068/g.11495 Transcript_6068/m.11495 type:complete len:616 (+) Transcript_6068:183-2030(+)|eukprot:CAMPEP_0176477848 /NCGR_PEP_ID=MMETSP0200_2-20121128/862_1 /TAXON_ID=947934 /ORGANISM="Chaetoceros sp., Strain GSL56" /LENGTH=615 /DNA_ID=CAMNT_0017873727 /DNA_START=88 /DNA_END=1935 /DNA_ORIENTATION=+